MEDRDQEKPCQESKSLKQKCCKNNAFLPFNLNKIQTLQSDKQDFFLSLNLLG